MERGDLAAWGLVAMALSAVCAGLLVWSVLMAVSRLASALAGL